MDAVKTFTLEPSFELALSLVFDPDAFKGKPVVLVGS